MVMNNKKGSAFVWLMITVLVFVIGIIYMIMTPVIIKIQGVTWDQVENDSDYAQSYNQVVLTWKYWPMVVFIGLIIVGIMMSLKQEPYSGYQP